MPSFKIIDLPVLEKKILKVFVIYSHGDQLGHVTLTSYTNFHFPFLTMLHIKFGFDWPSQEYYGHIHVYIHGGQAQTTPWGQNVFININFLSICILSARFPLFNYTLLIFPFKCIGDLS